ncbi:ovarian-specific serine/threonine-protein kinase lok-related [Anaeramoeba flamelloides]|uniref:Ovarian-specific serine/threonine-protein kinase lok-related n=1 Tax=Anaeramoeba flamelloides TaxID=1746091 RepID=A0AAV7Z0X2_9EUKA|nr:ovarian-specific serine/threonine-protein kinase lok-related [Anaeramoeba flamelloides]
MNAPLHIPNYTIGQQLKTTKKWKTFIAQNKATNHFAKVIDVHKSATGFNQGLEQLLSLVDQIKRFDHPHFVRLLQIYEDPKRYCLITDHFEGTTLRKFIKTNGRLESKLELNKIFIQLISITKYFHSNGFTHGNINPDLILINKNLNIKLKSFGFLKGMKKKITYEEMNNSFADHFTNEIICEQFIAPELMSLQPEVSKKNDLFSLGVCILFMVLDQKQFNNLFECNPKYKKLNKVKLPKWVGKKITILIKQMVQINQKNRIYLTDHKFLQFYNDFGFDKNDFIKEIKDIENEGESRKIYYEPKIILRMERLLNRNKKTIIKSLVKEKLDYNNAIYRLMSDKHNAENLSFVDEEYEKVHEIIKQMETNLKLQANNITTPTKYNNQNDTDTNKSDIDDHKNTIELKINITTNDEMIFDNRNGQYNDIKSVNNEDLKNIKNKSKENFNNMKTVIKTEQKQNREELYQILQNMEKSKSINKLPKKTQNKRINHNTKVSNNAKNILNNTQSNDNKQTKKQEIHKKKSIQNLKNNSAFSKEHIIQPTMEIIQKKHKDYLNNILSSEKYKLGKKFSPMQIKRINKRNNNKNHKSNNNYDNKKRKGVFKMHRDDNRYKKKTKSSKNAFQKSSMNAGHLIFLKKHNKHKNNNTLMINCNSLHNLHNHSNFPLSEKFSKSMDYLSIISRKGGSKYEQDTVYRNQKEPINDSYINEILNSTISSKMNIPLNNTLNRVNFVRLNCNLWDFYSLLKEITKNLNII